MRWFVTGLMLCLPAAVQAQERCGSGFASNGLLRMTVVITNADAGTHSPYVHVVASSPDASYELSVNYRPTEAGLGPPARLGVKALVPPSGPDEPEPHQIEWRAGSGRWFNPGHWSTPRRSGDEEETRGITEYTMAQSPPLPYRTELLEALAGGIRYEFRSLDRSGDIVGSGSVDYPAPQPIVDMYNAARAQAVAGLRPCGPPSYVRPAPDPGG